MPCGAFCHLGNTRHIRSDSGPEFAAKAVRGWLARPGVETLFIDPGSPWENGCLEAIMPPEACSLTLGPAQ